MKKYFLLLVLTLLLPSGALADQLIIDPSDRSKTIHPQPSLGKIPIEPAFEDYSYMLFDLCDAVGLECLIYPMMGEIDNALATITPDGTPIIVYDRRLSVRIGYSGAQAVIAHELGHHYCGHLRNSRKKNDHEIEKEADKFMGFAMKKLQVETRELFDTYKLLGIDKESPTHPSLQERKASILAGYSAKSLLDVCQKG